MDKKETLKEKVSEQIDMLSDEQLDEISLDDLDDVAGGGLIWDTLVTKWMYCPKCKKQFKGTVRLAAHMAEAHL